MNAATYAYRLICHLVLGTLLLRQLSPLFSRHFLVFDFFAISGYHYTRVSHLKNKGLSLFWFAFDSSIPSFMDQLLKASLPYVAAHVSLWTDSSPEPQNLCFRKCAPGDAELSWRRNLALVSPYLFLGGLSLPSVASTSLVLISQGHQWCS